VEFRNPAKAPGGWLPLEAFDNKELDSRSPLDWMVIKRKKKAGATSNQTGSEATLPPNADAPPSPSGPKITKTEIPAQGLWKDRDGLCYWRRLQIQKYLLQSERYEGYWGNTKEKVRLHRIYILFDDEDPREFAKRFQHAYETRMMADSLLKYNFYIENMPTHQIPEIDNEEVNRILSMTQNTKQLRGKSSSDTTILLSQVNFEFAKTMNKIIFDKHLENNGPNLISGPLYLPPKPAEEDVQYYGMIDIPQNPESKYPDNFSMFCFKSILNKDQSIRAQQEIRKECNDVLTKDIFNPNITKTMKVIEFKQIQQSATSQISYYLKETWVNKIKDIIKTNFAEDANTSQQFGRPWYSLNENSRETYEMGKLKKYLTQTKFVMQDTLLYMTQDSVKRFVESIIEFVPIGCEVKNSFEVINTFYTEAQIKEMGAPKEKIPLFKIDLMLGDDSRPKYSTSANEVVSTILTIFQNGVKSLQEINQVEQKLLPHLFKSNIKMFLKAVNLPEYRPEDPDPSDKGQLPDETTWLFDEYDKLRTAITTIISPLDDYIKTYNRFEKEYVFDPNKEMLQYEDPENWPEVD
jgi:dynein heavy chain